MKKANGFSTKRLAIDKASAQMVAAMSIASFLLVFSLIATQALWDQQKYLGRVTKAKEEAHKQLQTDIQAVSSLTSSYKAFVGTPTNVIGGSPTGSGDTDGDNAKIVLDALPAQYDFPALTSSLENILSERKLNISSIGGTDDQIAQQVNSSSPTPKAVPIPFTFSIKDANYAAIQDLITTLQKSIRPIQIDKLTLSGGVNSMEATVSGHTYYQPEKDLKITTTVIK